MIQLLLLAIYALGSVSFILAAISTEADIPMWKLVLNAILWPVFLLTAFFGALFREIEQ